MSGLLSSSHAQCHDSDSQLCLLQVLTIYSDLTRVLHQWSRVLFVIRSGVISHTKHSTAGVTATGSVTKCPLQWRCFGVRHCCLLLDVIWSKESGTSGAGLFVRKVEVTHRSVGSVE